MSESQGAIRFTFGSLFGAASVFVIMCAIGAALGGAYYLGVRQHEPRQHAVVPVSPQQYPALPAETQPARVPALPSSIGRETVADVAQAVSPSVVNIDVFSRVVDQSGDSDWLFNGNRMTPSHGLPLLPRLQKNGTGSGLIIRSDGYVVTNNHVVKGNDRIKVTLRDRRSFVGKIVGRDPLTDIAIVKIDAENLPVARLGSSEDLRPGEWAIAIGSPLGLDQTVTLGIISAIARSVADVTSDVSFIQTDAAINPGNSGGPLLNLNGEVIGINSFIRSDAQNIGFATPINAVKGIFEEIIAQGGVHRPWVGMKLANLSPELKKRLKLNSRIEGALVASVVPDGPAADSGLQPGDVITRIDDGEVKSLQDVQRLVRRHQVGTRLPFSVTRKDSALTLPVTVEEMPENFD